MLSLSNNSTPIIYNCVLLTVDSSRNGQVIYDFDVVDHTGFGEYIYVFSVQTDGALYYKFMHLDRRWHPDMHSWTKMYV